MDKHRLLHIPGRAEQTDKAGQIMPIHGPQIGQAHIFKQGARENHPLQTVLHLAGKTIDSVAAGEFFRGAYRRFIGFAELTVDNGQLRNPFGMNEKKCAETNGYFFNRPGGTP